MLGQVSKMLDVITDEINLISVQENNEALSQEFLSTLLPEYIEYGTVSNYLSPHLLKNDGDPVAVDVCVLLFDTMCSLLARSNNIPTLRDTNHPKL